MDVTTQTALTIREATPGDMPLIIRWREAMFREIPGFDGEQIEQSSSAFAAWMEERLAEQYRLTTFIGMVDDRPVACAMAWIYDWYPKPNELTTRRGYILNVYTQPEWRCHGFAGQLTQACLDWLRERGITSVYLHASQQGQPVYERVGFHLPGSPEMVCRLAETK